MGMRLEHPGRGRLLTYIYIYIGAGYLFLTILFFKPVHSIVLSFIPGDRLLAIIILLCLCD